ncbi:MAG TPA: hypothetical protein VMB23_09490, partial [Spirochaetia bacterium]|nr:hypothetical protein [Spirochaetia bacterium]
RWIPAGVQPVRIGRRTVEWRAFGFRSGAAQAVVKEAQTTVLEVATEPVVFSLGGLSLSRTGFHPGAPGAGGTLRIGFTAVAPGQARLEVRTADGTVAASWNYATLTWGQSTVWLGLDASGNPVPDGAYAVVLSGAAPGDQTREWARALVVVDSHLNLNFRGNALAPGAGLLWVPTPETLPTGVGQISAFALEHTGVVDDGPVIQAPVATALRAGLTPGWEVDLRAVFRLWSEPWLDAAYAGLTVKHELPEPVPGLQWALQAGGTIGSWISGGYGVPPTDVLTDFPALKTALPVGWALGSLTLLAAPELDLSPAAPSYGGDPGAGWRAWAYGRFGAVWDLKDLSLGASAVVRTKTFDRGAGLEGPVQAGLEVTLPIAGEVPFFLSALAGAELWSPGDGAFYGGVGIGTLLESPLPPDLGP